VFDNLTIDNLKIDTNRDGIDVDACKNVRISNCSINSPFDDGICPKSSYALGYARATENVTITNCQVSGYDEGTFLDGTFKREFRNQNVPSVRRAGSNSAPNQRRVSRTSPFPTASLIIAAASRSKRLTARFWKT